MSRVLLTSVGGLGAILGRLGAVLELRYVVCVDMIMFVLVVVLVGLGCPFRVSESDTGEIVKPRHRMSGHT